MERSITGYAAGRAPRPRLARIASAAIVLLLCWAGAAGAADPNKGRQIYMKHCQNCHGVNGTGQLPGIPDFARGEGLFKPDIELVRGIRAGRGMMPSYEGMFTEDELLDVVAFLRTLR